MGYFDNQVGMKVMSGKGTTNKIALNKICPRFVNKWIIDKEDAEGTKASIKENGLFSPITVNSISEYLTNSKEQLSKEAIEYYEKYQKQGVEYFITSGHTRFYAYCSLCLDSDIISRDELDDFYKKYDAISKADAEALASGKIDGRNKYLSIAAIIAKDDYRKERDRYNSANIDQRAKKDFEVISNLIDEMKDEGKWDEVNTQIKEKIIGGMADRAVLRNVEKIAPKTKVKTVEEAREILMNAPEEEISGYNQAINSEIKKYIYETRNKTVSDASINFVRKINNTLDQELIGYIYDGKLNYNAAREMLSFYDKIPAKDIPEIKKQIKEGSFNVSDIKKKYVAKKAKAKTVPFSTNDWKRLFIQLHDGDITIEDAYKKLKDLKVL